MKCKILLFFLLNIIVINSFSQVYFNIEKYSDFHKNAKSPIYLNITSMYPINIKKYKVYLYNNNDTFLMKNKQFNHVPINMLHYTNPPYIKNDIKLVIYKKNKKILEIDSVGGFLNDSYFSITTIWINPFGVNNQIHYKYDQGEFVCGGIIGNITFFKNFIYFCHYKHNYDKKPSLDFSYKKRYFNKRRHPFFNYRK